MIELLQNSKPNSSTMDQLMHAKEIVKGRVIFVPKIYIYIYIYEKGARSSNHISRLIRHTAGEQAIPRAGSVHILLTKKHDHDQ